MLGGVEDGIAMNKTMVNLGTKLRAIKGMVVTDPFTGYEGSFYGFLRQYPRMRKILDEAIEALEEKS